MYTSLLTAVDGSHRRALEARWGAKEKRRRHVCITIAPDIDRLGTTLGAEHRAHHDT